MEPITREQRSNSTSSVASNASTYSAVSRRPSHLFASLERQKRSNDPQQLARRFSMQDQRPKPSMFGRWWNGYVHGTVTANPAE